MNKTGIIEKRISISSDVRFIGDVRRAILGEMSSLGFDEDSKMSVAVALDECLTNAISHGNRRDPSLFVDISYRATPELIEIVISDQGPGFDWRKNQRLGGEADFTGYEVNGRGLFMIQDIMTSIRYNDRGNMVTITKKRA